MSGATRSFVLIGPIFPGADRFGKCRYGKKTEAMHLAEKKKGGNVVNSVWELAEPIVGSLGLMLWDVRYQKEGATRYLRIIIDKEGGVGIDDCVAVNDALDAPLDELDPISEPYNLQVCSAGIERELTRDFHFEKYIGSGIILKLRSAYNGVKLHKAVLSGYEDGAVTAEFAGGDIHTFLKNEITSVKLDDFDGFYN